MNIITKFSIVIIAVFAACNVTKEKDVQSESVALESKIEVIAHRGGAKLAPENTLAAFKKATHPQCLS